MKYLFSFAISLFLTSFLFGQTASQLPEFQLQKQEFEDHLMYLASDELGGRRTASEGGQLAANYLAEYFEKIGVKPVPGCEGFFQNIPFQQVTPPTSATLTLDGTTYEHGGDMLVFLGSMADFTAPGIFVGHGWADEASGHDDYAGLDVNGKIVFALPGMPNSNNPYDTFRAIEKKRELARQHGAIGIVELFRLNFPWRFFKSNFNKERLEIDSETAVGNPDFFHVFLKEGTPNPVAKLVAGEAMEVHFYNSGLKVEYLKAANVLGYIEGTDEVLKNEYVLLSAHYDHVGVGKQGGAAYSPQDSIFNGARDNGMGTVALMAAAKSLAASPPKRSIILLACTAEEIGLLGSAYYVEHPLLPLEQTVFNLNNDGAGYNSNEHFSVIGLERTDVVPQLEAAGQQFGLQVTGDPAPGQNLYSRSDNFNFAKVGIPAIDMAPGITEMDEAIYKYYHQAADNPDTIDYDYLLKFCQTFAHAARLVADREAAPAWLPGGQDFGR